MAGPGRRAAELPAQQGEFGEAGGDAEIDRAVGHCAIFVGGAGGQAGQQFEGLIDIGHRPDPEAAGAYRADDVAAQHQVADVGGGNQHAVLAGEATGGADVEETLDFFVDAADGLDDAELVHRAGDRPRLGASRCRRRYRVAQIYANLGV